MAIETNAKRVVKIMKGDTQVWTDTDTWLQLKLGTGVSGTVLFKDNGNGTASLVGTLIVSKAASTAVLYPPDGYQFVTIDWDYIAIILGAHGVGANGLNYSGKAQITNGALYFSGDSAYGTSYCVVFQRGALMRAADITNAADPALINIKSV